MLKTFAALVIAFLVAGSAHASPPFRGGGVPPAPTGDVLTQLLAAMVPNTWANPTGIRNFQNYCYINNTTAPDYNATVSADGNGTSESCVAMTGPYQSSAYDSHANRMLMGVAGGHAQGPYNGSTALNDILALDFASLTWSRINTPMDWTTTWWSGTGYVTPNTGPGGVAQLTMLTLNGGSGPIVGGMEVNAPTQGFNQGSTVFGNGGHIVSQASGTPNGVGTYNMSVALTAGTQNPPTATMINSSQAVEGYYTGAGGFGGTFVNEGSSFTNANCPTIQNVAPATHTYSGTRFMPNYPTAAGSLWITFPPYWWYWDLSQAVNTAIPGQFSPGLNWNPGTVAGGGTPAGPSVQPPCTASGWVVSPSPQGPGQIGGSTCIQNLITFVSAQPVNGHPFLLQANSNGCGGNLAAMAYDPVARQFYATGTEALGNGNPIGQVRTVDNTAWSFGGSTNGACCTGGQYKGITVQTIGTATTFQYITPTGPDLFLPQMGFGAYIAYHTPSDTMVAITTNYGDSYTGGGAVNSLRNDPALLNAGVTSGDNGGQPSVAYNYASLYGTLSPGNLLDIVHLSGTDGFAKGQIVVKQTSGPFGSTSHWPAGLGTDGRVGMPPDLHFNNTPSGGNNSTGGGDKLAYDPIHNCFILVTSANDPYPVYIYKPNASFPN